LDKVDRTELEQWTTRRLLGRLQLLRKCEPNLEGSDLQYEEEFREVREAMKSMVIFRETEAWADAYADLKAILATREHVPNSVEKKQERVSGASGSQKPRFRNRSPNY
jgi:hypothetical protein